MGNCTSNGDIDESAKVQQNTEQKDAETQEIEHSIKTEDDAVKPDDTIEAPKALEEAQAEEAEVVEPKMEAVSKDDTQGIDQQMKGLSIEEVDETKTTETTLEQDTNSEPEAVVEEDHGEDHKMEQEEVIKDVVENTEDGPPDSVVSEQEQAAESIPEPELETTQKDDTIEAVQENPQTDHPKEDEPEDAEAMVTAAEEDEPAVDEPAADEPAVNDPASDGSKVDEPTVDVPTVNVPTEEDTKQDDPKADEAMDGEATAMANGMEEDDDEFSGAPKTEQQIREEVERELKLNDNDPTENGSEDETGAQDEEPKKVEETKWEVVVEPNESPVIVEPDQATEQQQDEQATE